MKQSFLFIVVLALLLPLQVQAFSENFKKEVGQIQFHVMSRGGPMTVQEMEQTWKKFDEEILSLLNQPEKSTEQALNKEGAKAELSLVERYGKEMEEIELGSVQANFFSMGTPKTKKGISSSPIWLVVLTSEMGNVIASTFHLYQESDKESGGQYQLMAAFENMKGPWETEKLLTTVLQVQRLPDRFRKGVFQFATYYQPFRTGSQASNYEGLNRSQILWEFRDSSLKPLLWFPEVDWHIKEDKKVIGRGPAISL